MRSQTVLDISWAAAPSVFLWKIPHTHWCVNHASGVRTADWTLNVKPSQIKSNQSICYLTQNSSNISCRLEYRNRNHFSWSSCEKRVCLCVCQDVLSTYYHAAFQICNMGGCWLVVSYWPKSQVCVNQHFTWSSNKAIQNLEKWVANIV